MIKQLLLGISLLWATALVAAKPNGFVNFADLAQPQNHTTSKDSVGVKPLYTDPASGDYVIYDPKSDRYIFYKNISEAKGFPYKVMNREEYQRYKTQTAMQGLLLSQRSNATPVNDPLANSLIPSLNVGGDGFDKIFGSNTISIVPRGSVELSLGIKTNRTDNPIIAQQFRKTTIFDFQSKLQMNVTGMVGDKLKMDINYNTDATFDFENNVKVEYTGSEDEIIQKIEAGNVSLPLPGTLITGSQSLFGFKTQLKFGNLTMTSIFSRQRGQSQSLEIKGGAQNQQFEISADSYDANRHFLVGHYFREHYDQALSTFPLIQSGINITKMEVWVTNKTAQFDNARNIVAFLDLGESQRNIHNTGNFSGNPAVMFPSNEANNVYSLMNGSYSGIRQIDQTSTILNGLGLHQSEDYEKLENARKLNANEYTINTKLGYISLNTALNNDEILGVAYEYILNGKTYKVGELSTDGIEAPKALIVKLLKGTNLTPKLPNWNLMMKNIYSIGTYQVNKDNFNFNILYDDSKAGTSVNYISEGAIKNKPLLSVMNLDRLNSQNDPYPDGVFDFVDGITILSQGGKVIFPVLQPFGGYLRAKIGDNSIADKYVFQELYDSTLTKAKQMADKNRFKFVGTFQSSAGSEISLSAMNIPQGSVIVTAGGLKLAENIDYTVDYALGRVKIINQAYLESGVPIKVSLESQALFNIQTKTLVGSHFDYRISDNFHIGATVLNLTERPLTKKVAYSDEPISNTIWGVNLSYQNKAPWLTSLVQKIPFIKTQAPSSIMFEGEFAHFIPGHASAVGSAGNSYIDDFEGAKIPIDLRSWNAWVLASTPQGQADAFPEGNLINNLAYGYNRALLAWYTIDPLFLRNNSYTPAHIKRDKAQQSSHWVREIYEREIFPEKDEVAGVPSVLSVLNLAYYPTEKGPYNYDVSANSYSKGLKADGKLASPESRWGGIMRSLPINDFETANIDYIEFWLMDPFVYNKNKKGGDLIFNLGNISEDILRDGRKSFENGLPTSSTVTNVDTTAWGRVPLVQSLVNAFDNNAASRKYQDVGLDGLGSEDERGFFEKYLNSIALMFGTGSKIYQDALNDPSNDDYQYFRGKAQDDQQMSILDRYKRFNNTDGNSPASDQIDASYSTSATSLPDGEDINRDNTMSDAESYFQYKVPLSSNLEVGKNFVSDKRDVEVDTPTGKSKVTWYQFKIPVSDYEKVIGNIQDFKSVRFIRMMVKGFEDTTILRFAKLELVKGEWRKYNYSLLDGQASNVPEMTNGSIDVSTVSIEENSSRIPVNYILPPGIDRVIDPSNPQVRMENEQAMQLRVTDLQDGDARAAYKTTGYDFRQYKRLKMEVHAEAISGQQLKDGDLTIFMRLGTDYSNNYYEYEIPLKLTPYGKYSSNRDADRETVWPRDNAFNLLLSVFQDIKLKRYDAMRSAGSTVSITQLFSMADGTNTVRILGNPSLNNVKTIMVGIRNPAKSKSPYDDGQPKSGVVWINELRLSNFDEEGGWAANARVVAKLADLGVVSIAGSTMTPGFGSLESKLNDRNQKQIYTYDLAGDFELGKFFPEKAGVRIPMHLGYSESIANEKWSPTDQDIELNTSLKYLNSESERDSVRNLAQELTVRKSINFTNVGITKPSESLGIISPSNFSITYAYNEMYSRTPQTERQLQKNYRGIFSYAYNTAPKYFEPLGRTQSKLFRSPYLKLIKDFNVGYVPTQLSFISEITRNYNEVKTRNLSTTTGTVDIPAAYAKDFYWSRVYALQWDITKNLKLTFSANNLARIDEPEGIVDKKRDREAYQVWKDSVWKNIAMGGRNVHYDHSFNVRYNIPINKIPLFNWVSASAAYDGRYDWDAGPIMPTDSQYAVGNTIKNMNQASLVGNLNLVTLYNKVPLLRAINQEFDNPNAKKKVLVPKTYRSEKVNLYKGRKRNIYHGMEAMDIKVSVVDANGKNVDAVTQVSGKGRVSVQVASDVKGATVIVKGMVPYTPNPFLMAGKYAIRMVMGVRNFSATYTQNEGSILPGYTRSSSWFGTNSSSTGLAPGLAFILGNQNADLYDVAQAKGWLINDYTYSSPFVMTHMENFSYRTSIEPIKDLIIDITGNRSYSRNSNRYGGTDQSGTYLNGSFSISVIGIGSAFENPKSGNGYASAAFDKFINNREVISQRLAYQREQTSANGYHPNIKDGYADGYSALSQDVLLPAFLSAYTSASSGSVGLSSFSKFPFPNWSVRYQGLSKIEALKPYIRNADLEHSYRAVYTIGGYNSNADFSQQGDGFSYVRNSQNDFIARNEIVNVSMSEYFNPLLGVNVGWANNLQTQVRLNKSRVIALSLSNNQITEIRNSEWNFSLGYRLDNPIRWIDEESQKVVPTYLKVDAGLAFNNQISLIRKIVEGIVQASDGRNTVTMKLTADYMFNEKINLRAYFDRVINTPLISNTYPTANTSFGFSVRYNIGQ